ncbi:MAG: alpha-hydroxy-acid oxidizing protein [Alphaproteobacteria bacterium]|nr:alpha-hydroxy-acid oxidizing protein [Alphaproteobacteria bacterium]
MSEGGEVGLARAAARMSVPFTAATNSLTSVDDNYKAGNANVWFQLYIWKDMDLRMAFVERIKADRARRGHGHVGPPDIIRRDRWRSGRLPCAGNISNRNGPGDGVNRPQQRR